MTPFLAALLVVPALFEPREPSALADHLRRCATYACCLDREALYRAPRDRLAAALGDGTLETLIYETWRANRREIDRACVGVRT